MANFTNARNRLDIMNAAADTLLNTYRAFRDDLSATAELDTADVNYHRRRLRAAIASLKVHVQLCNEDIDTIDGSIGQSMTMTPLAPSLPTTFVRTVNQGIQQSRTLPVITPGLASPTVTGFVVNDRPVVDMSSSTGTVVLSGNDTIYDFGGAAYTAQRDITIRGNNSEARNISGTGARRIGDYGYATTDSGFRNFDFTYCQIKMDGQDITRPYWINGNDLTAGSYAGPGSPWHLYAYSSSGAASIHDPLIERCDVYGYAQDPGNPGHNDCIHMTMAAGGGRVYNPTVRYCNLHSGATLGMLYRFTEGTVTFEYNNSFRQFSSTQNCFQLNCDDVAPTVTLLFRGNYVQGDVSQGGQYYQATAFGGVAMHASSDSTLLGYGPVIMPGIAQRTDTGSTW